MSDDASDQVEYLVREHARFVYRLVYSLLRNHHDTEDVVQETFLRVCRNRSKLNSIEGPARVDCLHRLAVGADPETKVIRTSCGGL